MKKNRKRIKGGMGGMKKMDLEGKVGRRNGGI